MTKYEKLLLAAMIAVAVPDIDLLTTLLYWATAGMFIFSREIEWEYKWLYRALRRLRRQRQG